MTLEELASEIADLRERIERLEGRAPLARPESDGFLQFWSLYPRKVGRLDTSRAWDKLVNLDRVMALNAVITYAEVWKQASPDRHQYIKYPASWLRARAWEDGPEEWRKVAGLVRPAQKPLPGQHKDPARMPADLGRAPAEIQAIASKIVRKEDTTEEEDLVYYAWMRENAG